MLPARENLDGLRIVSNEKRLLQAADHAVLINTEVQYSPLTILPSPHHREPPPFGPPPGHQL